MINLPYKPSPLYELYFNSGLSIADALSILSSLCIIAGFVILLVLIIKRKEK